MSDVSAYSGELWVSISGSCIIETGRCLSLEPSVVLIMDKIAEPSDILVSLDEFSTLCTRISDDSRFACKVGDVLVEPSTRWQNMLKGSSLYQKYPQAQFGLYNNTSYAWNPLCSGIMWKFYKFPVFLLTGGDPNTLQEFVTE